MQSYIVLYHDDEMNFLDAPLGFQCFADDTEHAEEQCADAYKGCDIVWIYYCESLDAGQYDNALKDYYGITDNE
jgi:hypothetical protein